MQNNLVTHSNSDVVVALFQENKHVCDAVADLTRAGFGERQIRVAFGIEDHLHLRGGADANRSNPKPGVGDTHSVGWKFKQRFDHDLYRSGTDQIAGEDGGLPAGESKTHCSEVNLRDMLLPLGVTEERIQLLNSEMGAHGALVLVEAGGRAREAESILERDAGVIRTGTATERPTSSNIRI